MNCSVVESASAPRAIGPYSQAIELKVGDTRMLYTSGQIPLDPVTGNLVEGGIDVATERVMNNLQAVLAAARMDFSHVVKTTIFLVDLADFAKVNEVYGRAFTAAPPARSTVQVAALPKGARVEIEMVAART
ncbi:MAG: RidA family protein [Deltaproteobacteria bacterium]|nr:RidA family protein [Deltaproteobacteria bacterium]